VIAEHESVCRERDFLARLRSETRTLHTRAEAPIPADAVIDRTRYASLLGALLPVYAGIEERLGDYEEWAALHPPLDVDARSRARLLADDLRTLGADERPRGSGDTALPQLGSFEEAFGALYVLEGSRLGGRVLARQIGRSTGAAEVDAFRFFASDGADVGELWTDLRAALGRYAAGGDAERQDALIRGASETFSCFDRELGRWSA